MKIMSREFIAHLKEQYPSGTRVTLNNMENEPQMPHGLEGAVLVVDDIGQIHVNWDNGSTLALNVRTDSFVKAVNDPPEPNMQM